MFSVDNALRAFTCLRRLHHDKVMSRRAFDYRCGSWRSEIDDPYRYVRRRFEISSARHASRHSQHDHARHRSGVHFAVWAPNARGVSVVGDFNAWDGRVHPMRDAQPSGYWETFIPELGQGDPYKFEVIGADGTPC